MDDSPSKEGLQARLDAIRLELEAKEAVSHAEETKQQADVDSARDLVEQLPEGEVKEDLTGRLDKVQEEINIREATKAVEQAEQSRKQEDVDKANELVDKITDPVIRQELKDRINAIEVIKDSGGGSGSGRSASDEDLEQEARRAVEHADHTKQYPDLETAIDLVDRLPEGDVRDELLREIERIKEEIRLIEIAQKSVNDAAETKVIDNLEKAKTDVEALPPSKAKDKLITDLVEVKETAVSEVDRQTEAVVSFAETSKTISDIDTAEEQTEVFGKYAALVIAGESNLEHLDKYGRYLERVDVMRKAYASPVPDKQEPTLVIPPEMPVDKKEEEFTIPLAAPFLVFIATLAALIFAYRKKQKNEAQ